MSVNRMLDKLLDQWECLLESNPQADLDEFIDQWGKSVNDQTIQELRKRVAVLAAMNQRLVRMDETATNFDDTVAEAALRRGFAFTQLTPGFEPIPGYQLIKKLGAGGFGEVWKATGPGGFYVALKFVQLGGQGGDLEQRALGVIKDVRHPHLLSVFGTWRSENLLIIAMELADRTLLDRFHEARNAGYAGIPREELLEYLNEAAKGIDVLNNPQQAGRLRIQHRDIKPQNLLLLGGGVKVGDFGLARSMQFDATGHTGSMTLKYAAPEFLEGRTSSQSDQFSLAVTYCHLLTGRFPFDGNFAEIIDAIRHRSPDLTTLPKSDRAAVAKALSKMPHQRFATCSEFVRCMRSDFVAEPLVVASKSQWFKAAFGLKGSVRNIGYVIACVAVLCLLVVTSRSLVFRQQPFISRTDGTPPLVQNFPASFVTYKIERTTAEFPGAKNRLELSMSIDESGYERFRSDLINALRPGSQASGRATLGLNSSIDVGAIHFGHTTPKEFRETINNVLGFGPTEKLAPRGCVVLVGEKFLDMPWKRQDSKLTDNANGRDTTLVVDWFWVSESAVVPLCMAFRRALAVEIDLKKGDLPLPPIRLAASDVNVNVPNTILLPGGPLGCFYDDASGRENFGQMAAYYMYQNNLRYLKNNGDGVLPLFEEEHVILLMPRFLVNGKFVSRVVIADVSNSKLIADNPNQIKVHAYVPAPKP